jgi:predicted AlkP superfamily phosphohydrolase/phosphomutase
MADRSAKVLVVGLDGGTFRLLNPLMERGLLPNLASLADEGVWGELQSTIPPITAPAWSSFMTGKNPGKHRLFSWQEPVSQGGDRNWVNSHSIRGEKLWHAVGRQDRSVGVLNVPMTYPPEEVCGFLVSGMLTPSIESEFTYPRELGSSLRELRYVIDVYSRGQEITTDSEDALLQFSQGLEEALLSKRTAINMLWPQRLDDFSMVVFETPDRIQHFMWGHLEQALDQETQGGQGEIITRILDLYCKIDEIVGQLLSKLDDNTFVFVVSDHGFCGLHTYLHLNNWLASEGLLTYARRIGLRRHARGLFSTAKRVLPKRAVDRGRRALGAAKLIDWPRTKAYRGHPSERAIHINLQGREPNGIVEPGVEYEQLRQQIKSDLMQLRDPRNGSKVVDRVFLPEEIYSGPYVGEAPDLLLEMSDGYHIGFDMSGSDMLEDAKAKGLGVHERAGILIAWGPAIRRGRKIDSASIVDVAPTALYAMGLAIPDDMDGKVLQELFEPGLLETNPVRCTESHEKDTQGMMQGTFSEEEAKEIQKRLEGLGYLG